MSKIICDQISNLQSFNWNTYFKRNKSNLIHLDYSINNELSSDEIKLIQPSIQAFQLGEKSEGNTFISKVDKYIASSKDHIYKDNIEMFIVEENRHSNTLLRYMEIYSIPSTKTNSLDNKFRFIRKLFNLEFEIITLVTAEMIALSYYDALANATKSTLLKSICQQMLYDESYQVIFQSQTLYKLTHNYNPIKRKLIEITRKLLISITTRIVYYKFKELFKAGGYTLSTLLHNSNNYLKQSLEVARTNEYNINK